MHRISALVFLTQGTGEIVAVTQDFRVQEPFTLGVVCLCVPYRFRWYVYVSLSIVAMYAMVYVCVFPCLCWEFSLSYVLGLWIVAIIHFEFVAVDVPWFWVAVELFWPHQGQEQLCVALWA